MVGVVSVSKEDATMAIPNPVQRVFLGEQDIAKCRAVLRILSDDLDPEEISRDLELEPTKAWSKGQSYPSKKGAKYARSIGLWQLSTDENPSKSVENHCRWLLSKLKGRRDALKRLRLSGQYRISIILSWNTGGPRPGGYNLASSTMRSIADLCDDIELHFL